MIPRSRKAEEPESDSDWDSLPGDVSERVSSPEPAAKTKTPSLSPVPPKQPSYGKQSMSTKPTNMYKNSLNTVKKSGSATVFQDRSGGLWDDDGADKSSFSKNNNNNNVKNNNNVIKDKKERKEQEQEQEPQQKRPPFTDFRDALSSPMPPLQNRKDQHELAGINQAYRVDKEEIHTTINHDSWDDSENESVSQLKQIHAHPKERNTGAVNENIGKRTQKHGGKRIKQDESNLDPNALELVQHQMDLSPDLHFENCCLIHVAHGPFDDKYRPSFFHGSKNHFHIKEDDPRASITDIEEKSEVVLRRFWREVFGVLQIVINFFIIFILELLKVIVHSLRNLLTGILYVIGDHFIKPLLSALFNNIIQPLSILLLNIFAILANLLKPLLALTRELCSQLSIPLRAFRLFELNWEHRSKENSCKDVKVI